jgi:hypothetical protein
VDYAEEFMYLVNKSDVRFELSPGQKDVVLGKKATRGGTIKDKEELVVRIAQHVGGIIDEDAAFSAAFAQFMDDEARRLKK